MAARCSPRRAAVLAAVAARVDQGNVTSWYVDPKSERPSERMAFYLGGHRPYWLAKSRVPMFISATTLGQYKGRGGDDLEWKPGDWPINKHAGSGCTWALDSGGFTELRDHGDWRMGPDEYGGMITRFLDEVGMIPFDFAAPQDWMCEPWVIQGGVHKGQRFHGTGLTAKQHIDLTVMNYCYLAEQFDFIPWIPVLQGYTLDDYLYCDEEYRKAGVDLAGARRVGLGSVCRREATAEIAQIVATFAAKGYRLHGFGVKTDGLKLYGQQLASADSMAWSKVARLESIQLPATQWGRCEHDGVCNNCLRWALVWRELVLAGMNGDTLDMDLAVLVEAMRAEENTTGQLALDLSGV